VYDVVFEFPDESASAQGIEAVTHDIIHPLLTRVASVTGIVHHIKSDHRQEKTENATQWYNGDNGKMKKKEG
jgi:hypothetical protein